MNHSGQDQPHEDFNYPYSTNRLKTTEEIHGSSKQVGRYQKGNWKP